MVTGHHCYNRSAAFSVFICLYLFPAIGISGETLVIPSLGTAIDIAVQEETLWSFSGSVPIVWRGKGLLGFSLSPTVFVCENDYTLYLGVQGVLNVLINADRMNVYLLAGLGPGFHSQDNQNEMVLMVEAGVGLIIGSVSIRMILDGMLKNKYYNDLDTYLNIGVGVKLRTGRRL